MRLKYLFIVSIFFGSFLGSLTESKAQVYSSWSVQWTTDNKVKSVSTTTILDYQTRLYYKAGVDALLYDQVGRYNSGSEVNPTSATVHDEVLATPGFRYVLHAQHYLRPYGTGYPGITQPGNGETYYDALGYAARSGQKPPAPVVDLSVFQQTNPAISIHDQPASGSATVEGDNSPNVIGYNDILVQEFLIFVTLELRQPHIDDIGPSGAPRSSQGEIMVRLVGQFLQPDPATGIVPEIIVSGNGVTARPRTGYRDEIGLDTFFTIAPNADVGDHNVTVSVNDPAGRKTSNAVVFRVGDGSPIITGISQQQGQNGEVLGVIITGQHFGLNPQILIDGGGIGTAINVQSPTEINVTFAIGETAPPGERGVKVKSLGVTGLGFQQTPGASDISNAVPFNILASADVDLPNIGSVENRAIREFNVTARNTNGSQTHLTIENPSDTTKGQAGFSQNENEIVLNGDETKTIRIKGLVGSENDNNIKLKAVYGNNKHKEKSFSVSWVEFLKKGNCDGFDDLETHPPTIMNPLPPVQFPVDYQLIGQGVTRTFKARIRPSNGTGNFRLHQGVTAANHPPGLTISPQNITSSNDTDVSVTPFTNAVVTNYRLEATSAAPGTVEPASYMVILVRRRKQLDVVQWKIDEENDDVQDTPVGQGSPNRVAFIILPGPNNQIDSLAGGDDFLGFGPPGAYPPEYRRNFSRLRRAFTGVNGVTETTVSGDDIIYYPPGGVTGEYTYQPDEPYQPFLPLAPNTGVPYGTCVSAGGNRLLDTLPNSGDEERPIGPARPIPDINSGADGICQTAANNTNTPGHQPISAAALENFINNQVWGRQANYYVSISTTVRTGTANYDLNRDGAIEPADLNPTEFDAVWANNHSGRLPGDPLDMYFLGMPFRTIPNATALAQTEPGGHASVFGNEARALVLTSGAHELGHAMGDNDRRDDARPDLYLGWIMNFYDQPNATTPPCRTGLPDWARITFIESNP